MRSSFALPSFVLAGSTMLLGQPGAPLKLSLQEAEAMALKNHPQVLAAQNVASATNERITENRAAYYPTFDGYVTGSQGNHNARIGAGYLTDSRLFNRFGQGLELHQLITDSGRTSNLVASSRFQAGAAEQNYQATRYDVLLAVNQDYFNALRAQALVRVAQQTVGARQLVVDQITTLAQNNLRSQLDVSFANVNFSEAKLLLIQAQDEVQRAFAEFTRALGNQTAAAYQLAEQPLPPSPPADAEQMVAQAVQNRPELASLRLSRQSAYRFEQAEKDLSYPTVTFEGVGGYIPYITQVSLPRVTPNEYEGLGINVQVPIFNGHLFTARRQEAHYRALESDQRLRDMEQSIARDVRMAWAASMTAYQRIDVTAELLRQASMAVDLAQGRYNLGLSSIVELTQAELNQTQAEIDNLNAKYDYQAQYAALQYATGALR